MIIVAKKIKHTTFVQSDEHDHWCPTKIHQKQKNTKEKYKTKAQTQTLILFAINK